jgi:nickel-dependent lactate racemase
MIYFAEGSPNENISLRRISELLDLMLNKMGKIDRVLLLPPDFTRYHSLAGEITCMLYEKLESSTLVNIMPAVGTHAPMSRHEIDLMYPGIPFDKFLTHDWQNDLVCMGTITSETIFELTGGLVNWPVKCEINRQLSEGKWDHIISIGQLVPHELIGISNHNKNILVGAGGKDIIGKTHMIGALYGTERMMGQTGSPVRDVLNYMTTHFLDQLPISYIMTVRGTDSDGKICTRGIFAGNDGECYDLGARLCQKVNITLLDREYKKVIAYLDPEEFKSVWVGNKAMLRTRMCIANGGELIILCPGIQSFGENSFSDAFIRKYGYQCTDRLISLAKESSEFEEFLIPLSQMIISDTGKRFKVTYAAKRISKEEIESVFCHYAAYDEVVKKYDPFKLQEGENVMEDGETIFFVSKPALGLWISSGKFKLFIK